MPGPIVFKALRCSQPVGEIYVGVLSAKDLLSMCEFEFRQLVNEDLIDVEFMGIQRPYSPKRIKEISTYVKTSEATFPTGIVISIDERCVLKDDLPDGIVTILVDEFIDPEDADNSIPLYKAARIIDGQHRLKGIEAANAWNFELPVTVFVGADDALRAAVFSTVNLAQTKVNKSLVYDLFAVAQGRSPQKTAHEIVVALDSAESSPFRHSIKRLGARTRTAEGLPIPGREDETLSQATVVRGILKHISRDPAQDLEAERKGQPIRVTASDRSEYVFRHLYAAKNDAAILINIANYFNAAKTVWAAAWEDDTEGVIIRRTNGYDGLIRFLKPAYLKLKNDRNVVPKAEYEALLRRARIPSGELTTARFPPGTAGASALYKALLPALDADQI